MARMTQINPGQPDRRVTYGDIFAVREYRALWLAEVLSEAGDQLARVALSVLVFDRTGSALLTGVTYAMTFLPWAVGGPLTAGLADRLPRRTLMIICDVVRALMVVAVTLPGLPLWVMLLLLFVGGLFAPLFSSARAALIPHVLPDEDRYVVASAIDTTTINAAQVLGFAIGGTVVALLGARLSLLFDAATFLASALVVAVGVRSRVAAKTKRTTRGLWAADLRAGSVLVFGDHRLRKLVFLGWLCSFYVAPEALAAPYVHSQQAGPVAVGLLLAANPVGSTVGALVVGRFVSTPTRQRWMVPMAVLTGVPLMVCILQPGLTVTWLLWAASGVFSAYNLVANVEFALAVPDTNRGQAFGLVVSGMMVGQGVGLILAGLLAEYLSPMSVVAIAGLLTVLGAASLVRPSDSRKSYG